MQTTKYATSSPTACPQVQRFFFMLLSLSLRKLLRIQNHCGSGIYHRNLPHRGSVFDISVFSKCSLSCTASQSEMALAHGVGVLVLLFERSQLGFLFMHYDCLLGTFLGKVFQDWPAGGIFWYIKAKHKAQRLSHLEKGCWTTGS